MKIITSSTFSLKNNTFYPTKLSTGTRNTSKVAKIVYQKATDSLDQLIIYGYENKPKLMCKENNYSRFIWIEVLSLKV